MQIFQYFMKQYPKVVNEDTYQRLAKDTEGYTGADLQQICKDAQVKSQMKVLMAKKFMKVK